MMQAEQGINARAQYEVDGFHISPQPVVGLDVVSAAIEGMDAVREGVYDTGCAPEPSPWNPGDDPSKFCKIEMPQAANAAIMNLVSHPAIGQMAAALTGARMIQVWWVQLLYKPPSDNLTGHDTVVGWHQDRMYWSAWESASELLTAWVALSDVTEEAGPMTFVRGSNRWNLGDSSDFYGQDRDGQRQKIKIPPGQRWEEVSAILPPGGVSFHHNLTYHSSGPNTSSLPRRSFAVHLRTEKSEPANGKIEGLTRFIEDPSRCPVIFSQA